MTRCYKCGGHLSKVHRRLYERLFYSDAFECVSCNTRAHRFQSWWFSPYRFIFSRYTVCVRCGTYRVHRLSGRDTVDSVSKHPFSLMLQILRAPRNKCPYCRLQYHDLRRVAPRVEAPKNRQSLRETA